MTPISVFIHHQKKRHPSRGEWRVLVKEMIESVTDSPVDLLFDGLGRPYIDHPNVSISYAHTKDAIALALAQGSVEIGLDVEDASRIDEIQEIRESAFSHKEQYPTTTDLVSNWCLKGAAVKMYGRGFHDHNPVEVVMSSKNSLFSARVRNKEIENGGFEVIKKESPIMAICSDRRFSLHIKYWDEPIEIGAKDDA